MSYYRYQNSSYYSPSLFRGFQFFPPVIKYLMIINITIFVLANFLSLFHIRGTSIEPYISYIFALYPLDREFQPWQLFTYMFMHGNLFPHLFFNMFALWMFGMELENQWGSKKFLIYYLTCGIGAGISNLLIAPLFAPVGPTVGASGAVYGILIAFGILYPNRPIFLFFLLPIRAKYFVIFYLLLEVFACVTGTPDGIAHFAHLGGAFVGWLYITIEQKSLQESDLFNKFKTRISQSSPSNIFYTNGQPKNVSDANFYDIDKDDKTNQQRIDEILDKISESGYQSLTEEEKKILFEASNKLN